MIDIDEVIARLAAQRVLFQEGKGGLFVTPLPDGEFLIHATTKNLTQRRPTEKEISAILSAFPKLQAEYLARFLVRNQETSRRAQMLEERQKSPFFTRLESLDTRPLPPPGKLDARAAAELPRLYAALDLSNPKRPSLALFGSEFGLPTKGLRADEAMLAFDLYPDDLKRLEQVGSIKDLLPNLAVRNMRAVYLDDNRVETGKARLTHHLKSLETMEAWMLGILGRYELQVRGRISLYVEDDFVDATGVRFSEQGASLRRGKDIFSHPGLAEQRFRASVQLELRFGGEGGPQLRRLPDRQQIDFIRGMAAIDRRAVERRLDQLVERIEKVFTARLKAR